MLRTRILALLLLLSLPVGTSHAVPADLSVAPFGGPLPVEGERSTSVVFEYRCGGLSDAASEPGMTVAFRVEHAPSWARLRVDPERLDLEPCDGVGRATATLRGSASADVVALAAGEAVVLAVWSTGGVLLNQSATVGVEPPFLPVVDVEAPVREIESRPQTPVVFPLRLTSRATAAVKVHFEIVAKEGEIQVPIPPPVTLPGPDSTSRTIEVPFVVQTPYRNGPMDEAGSVTIRLIPAHAFDPRVRGEPEDITLSVHTKGFYVPGLASLGAMLALACAAAVLSRRR